MTVESGRRDYDRDIDPVIVNYVEGRFREHRHAQRDELAVIGTQIATAALLSTKEHAEVKGSLDLLLAAVTDLRKLEPRVAALELAEAKEQTAAATTERLRDQSRAQFYKLAGLIVAAAGVIVAFGH